MSRLSDYLLTQDKSMRTIDVQGFLHVETSNISKAIVNPYLGKEIPGYDQLKLDPQKVYYVLRPPDELAKAAPTFNMLPLLDKHIEVSAFDLQNPEIQKHVVGATGNTAEFKNPYLTNSLVIHTAGAIEGILSKEQCELSCAYRYEFVPEQGEFGGVKYDGKMKNIVGNHVALVTEGRAGPDVIVKDEAMKKGRFTQNRYKQALACGDIATREDINSKQGESKYSNVKFADSKNHKYPLDTEAHVRAASSYWGMAKNKAEYSPEDQDVIGKRIARAEKKFKIGKFVNKKVA